MADLSVANSRPRARRRFAAHQPKQAKAAQTSAVLQKAIGAHRDGHLDKAERLYRTVLKRDPRDAIALNDLGVLLVQRGQKEPAEELIHAAVIIKPDYAEAHANLGTLLRQKGETDAAIVAFKRAVAAKPDYADAHCNLALALEKKGDTDEALAAFERAIEIRPDHAEAQFGRANALKAKGRGEEAIAGYRAAIALKPDYAAAQARLGIALTHAGEVDEAIAAYRLAIDCKLQSPEVYSNLALTLLEKDETDAAIAEFRQALMQAPNWPHAHFGLSLALLKKGEHAEGWREYEWRWKGAIEKVEPRDLPKPQWQGEDLAGKTLLLYAEQGLGDTLQFVRFVSSLAERGGRVLLEVPGKLFSLLRMSGVAENLLPAGAALPEFDFHLPLLSVPAVVGLAEETIPADVPYLAADPARVARWHERLPVGGFRVGIVWQGFPNADIDKGRSIPLRCFAPLAAVRGVRLISLQKNYGLDQLEALPDGMRVETLGADFDAGPGAFLDTAAVMAELDLIITSDTSVAHLAGALGRPVWVVLKTNPDWRWLQDREDSAWYPTARLFRQRMRGDWDEVLQRAAVELAQVAGGNAEKLFPPGKNLPADDRADRACAQFGEGFRLHKEGLLREAAAAYCKTVTLDPNHAEAYSNLGVIRHAHGKIDDAIALYRRAIEIKPDHTSALGNLVVALTAKGDIDGALAASRQAVTAKPDDAEARLRLGDLLRRKDEPDGALASYRKATALKPSSAKAWFSLAFCLQTKGHLDAAIRDYRQAIAIDPQLVQAHANLGVALADSGLAEEGIAECRQAIALRPGNAQYHSNLGLALSKAGDLDAAFAQYRRAVEIDPNYAEGNTNLALALLDKGMVREAISCNRKAIASKPDYAEAHFNLSLALLLSGDFSEGWKEYEWRWKGGVKELKLAKSARPQWQGEDLPGKTLLLQAEQGLGDVLQFARFAAVLAERGARIILAVPRELAALLRTVPGAATVVSAGDRLPPYDFYVPMMSVPAILGTTEATIPKNSSYLSADPERVAFWRARLRSDGFKIGIVWQGRPDAKIDKGRSVPLQAFEAVAAVPGVRLISLQKNHGLDQLGSLPPGMCVETLGADFDSGPDAFVDTAAVMENLDLVITSDTSVAHLAGALGRPVWIVLKHMPDWRWLLEREDSPWYPTARLFRQSKAGDWTEVFERVARDVARLASEPRGARATSTTRTPILGGERLTALKDCRHGRMLFLKGDQYIGRSLDLYGEFSELEAGVIAKLLRANDVVVEVGANIGAHTIPMAKLVGAQGLVFAFEPQRVIHELLCANLALNELFNVQPYRAALGRSVGTIKVPILDYASESNFGGLSLSQSDSGEEVPLIALDSFALPSLRMLKVDVEGMEAEVLSGARETIARFRPILYVENDRRAKSQNLIRLIEALDYKMWWHKPPLFNPGNFARRAENIFGNIVSKNLLCFPKESPTVVSGLRPVTGLEDWV